jgi:polyphosphate kinase 2 (PPK2 family)
MLEKLDLNKTMKRAEWKELRLPLQIQLYDLQKAAYDIGLPVIVLFEGWDAAGKGTSIGMLTQRLDPRGFKSGRSAARTCEMNHPGSGASGSSSPTAAKCIFDRSWYGRVLVERVEKLIPEEAWRTAYRDIVDFEQMLSEDGHVIVKFWLHISREEQRRRFKLLEQDPLESWHVAPEDWEHHRRYDEYLRAAEEMLERTECEWGPWTIVEATDQQYTLWRVLSTRTDALDNGLRRRGIDTDALSAEAMAAAAARHAKPIERVPDDSTKETELAGRRSGERAPENEGAPRGSAGLD